MSNLLDRPDIVAEFPVRLSIGVKMVSRARRISVGRDGDSVLIRQRVCQADGVQKDGVSSLPVPVAESLRIELHRALYGEEPITDAAMQSAREDVRRLTAAVATEQTRCDLIGAELQRANEAIAANAAAVEPYRALAKAVRALADADISDDHEGAEKEAWMAVHAALAAIEKIENPTTESTGS